MSSILVINAAGRETRVALVENGHISEFYLERKKDKGVVGNIYKGRVTRVLPGMQAAFVEIGLDKAAFLYVSDVYYDPEFSRHHFELTEGEHEDGADVPEVPDESDSSAEGDDEGGEEGAAEASAPPTDATEAETEAAANEARADAVEVDAAPTPAVGVEHAALASPPPLPPSSSATTQTDLAPVLSGVEGPVVVEAAPPVATPPSGTEVVEKAIALADASGEHRAPKELRAAKAEFRRRREEHHKKKAARIEDLLKVGQEVLVQISKDPIGTKGARLTSHISIPGRHLVFMPTVDHVGISRRIGNERERRRLREIVDRLRPPGTGFIVRTVAENVPQEKLEADIRFLIEVWNETVRKNEKRHQPGLMHPDLDLILRATRDLFAQDVEKLVIDDREEYERVLHFVGAQDAALKERILLHDNDEPIFDAYGIEEEIKRATQRKVWLKSGGYLIVDQAEALTAIDVNSGRYVGKKSLEETITKINTEAAKEIVYQLRLRNIGGIIICDFIDMEKQQNRDKVFKALQEALGRDKAKTNVLRISELGLVEMTRKRVRESIGRVLHEDCRYCEGQGYVKTSTTVAYEIFRELRRSAGAYKDPTLVIQCQTEVANLLLGEEKQELRHLMDRFNKSIQVRSESGYHREQYDLYARAAQGGEHKVASSGDDFEAPAFGPTKQKTPEARAEGRDRGGRREKRRDRDRDRNRQQGGQQGQPNRPPQNAPPKEPAQSAPAALSEPATHTEAK